MEADWATLGELVYNTATEILGPSTRKHKDWFDENCDEIKQLLDEKHRLHQAYLSSPKSTSKKNAYNTIRKTVQQKLRQMQDTWLRNKADVIQSYADSHDLKNFYDARKKEVYGPTSSGSSPLISADGNTLFTDKEKILVRWAEHFNSVLNRPSSINNETINRLPHVPINEALDDPPTLLETQKAIRLLFSGKAPGSDSIPAEVYKEGGSALTEKLQQLFLLMWQQETIPQEFKDASTIHLYKRKGNHQVCTTTDVYPCSPLQARYLPGSCLTVSQRTLTRDSYQRASVDSGKSAGPPTRCSLQGSCKRNVRSRTLTCSLPMST